MVSLRILAIFNALLLRSVASGQSSSATVDEAALLDLARSFPILTTLQGFTVNATQTLWLDNKVNPQYKGFKTQEVNYYCNFYGVNCNAAGAVDSINLDSSGLRGTLPTSMGSLLSLTYFSVGANYISGTIPATVGEMKSLHTLRIFDNDVLGTIPTSISLLTNMVSLELDVNYLSGSVPTFIGTLTKLTTCHLYDNSLSGNIPSNIGSLTNLNYLRWEFNALGGTIPSTISALTALHTMYLNNNDFGGTIPSTMGTMTNLRDVNLSQNFLTGTIPDLSALEKLLILDLSSNKLTMGGASVLSDTVFSPLTLMGPLNLSNNCINFPPKFKAIASCRIPTSAPTMSTKPTTDDKTDDEHGADDDNVDDETDDVPEPPVEDDDDGDDDDGDDDVVDTTKTTVSQDFTFVGTVEDPEMLEFEMAIGRIILKLLGLPDSDLINFVSLTKTRIILRAMKDRALGGKGVDYTLIFSLLSTSGKSPAEIIEMLGKIIMDGSLNKALAEEGFTFTVTATKGPTIVQANSEKSSSLSSGGSTTTKAFGAGLGKSPLWALVALFAIPLIACGVCVYVGYRCKRKEKKNVLEGLEAEDPSADMYTTGAGYVYPPEEKKVIVE